MQPLIGITPSLEDNTLQNPLAYTRAVTLAGGAPVVLSPFIDETSASMWASRLDGLLLSGGDDIDPSRYGHKKHPTTTIVDPRRDVLELALIEAFIAAGKPIFGICRGIQILNVALGGTLIQHIPDLPGIIYNHGNRDTRHFVTFTPGSILAESYGKDRALCNSTHHQAVDMVAPGFEVTAISDDGVIEGIQRGNLFGVQWHPERLYDEGHASIFRTFVGLC